MHNLKVWNINVRTVTPPEYSVLLARMEKLIAIAATEAVIAKPALKKHLRLLAMTIKKSRLHRLSISHQVKKFVSPVEATVSVQNVTEAADARIKIVF